MHEYTRNNYITFSAKTGNVNLYLISTKMLLVTVACIFLFSLSSRWKTWPWNRFPPLRIIP
jgi:hypothetical protein